VHKIQKKRGGVAINTPKTITNEQSGNILYWLTGRYKIIFDLAVQSGLRISDILSLQVKDIYNPMTIYEKKSKRKRTFAISNELYKRLCVLVDFSRGPDSYIFESHHKNAVSVHRSTVHRQIKKAAKWSGLDCSAHSARKLYAQNALQETGSVEKVQKLLNHQKISTTYRYLQQNPPDADESATEQPRLNIFSRFIKFFKGVFKIA